MPAAAIRRKLVIVGDGACGKTSLLSRLRPLSYSKSHVILIAFSIDTHDSLDNVQTKWIEEVRSICGEEIPVLLVGCKMDLRKGGPNEVSKAQGEQIALQIGARTYLECSALKNEGVDDVFEAATRAAMLVRTHGGTGSGDYKGSKKSKGSDGREKRRKDNSCCVLA
ncbi:ras-domain-containing protein [Atractiella rhizophila]|nr:ras-domain-containing protein [Atractiella rhizophila]